jgi:RNA polymerase sigma factor (sigma-70 family)
VGEDDEPGSVLRPRCFFSIAALKAFWGTLSRTGPSPFGPSNLKRVISSRTLENTDPLLHPFLQAEDESQAQGLLEQVIAEHAQPLVCEIVHSKLRPAHPDSRGTVTPQEAEDVCNEAVVQLLGRLRDLHDGSEEDGAIANFRGYVATVAYNFCTQSLRQRYPERHRLKNRLRYLLNHDPRFALWEDARGSLLCGLAEWKDAAVPPLPSGKSGLQNSLHQKPNLRQLPPRALIQALFTLCGRPVELDELVGVAGDIWGIQDLRRIESHEATDGEIWNRLPDPRVNVAMLVERRMYLAALWKEIGELRPRQRAALLLNLHDAGGQDMLPLFVLVDVARFSEIASALDMTMEELADLWDDLPLEDATIAQRMGLTRQQVINLRKSARERLARRMSGAW